MIWLKDDATSHATCEDVPPSWPQSSAQLRAGASPRTRHVWSQAFKAWAPWNLEDLRGSSVIGLPWATPSYHPFLSISGIFPKKNTIHSHGGTPMTMETSVWKDESIVTPFRQFVGSMFQAHLRCSSSCYMVMLSILSNYSPQSKRIQKMYFWFSQLKHIKTNVFKEPNRFASPMILII